MSGVQAAEAMIFPAELEPNRAELDSHFRRDATYWRHVGVQLLDWGPGWAVTRLATGPHLANIMSAVHGAAIASVGDAAFEVACNSYGRRCVGISVTCQYVAPVDLGAILVARAHEVSRSRRMASYRVDIRNGEGGPLVAWLMCSCFRRDDWHHGAERYPDDWRSQH